VFNETDLVRVLEDFLLIEILQNMVMTVFTRAAHLVPGKGQ